MSFQGTMLVGSPIQIQTALPPGTQIPSNRPFTVQWTGGDAGTRVKLTLTSESGIVKNSSSVSGDTALGSITFQPLCSGFHDVVCTFGIPASNNAQVTIEVSPAPATVAVLAAQGISGTVSAPWTYRYIFGGLILQ